MVLHGSTQIPCYDIMEKIGKEVKKNRKNHKKKLEKCAPTITGIDFNTQTWITMSEEKSAILSYKCIRSCDERYSNPVSYLHDDYYSNSDNDSDSDSDGEYSDEESYGKHYSRDGFVYYGRDAEGYNDGEDVGLEGFGISDNQFIKKLIDKGIILQNGETPIVESRIKRIMNTLPKIKVFGLSKLRSLNQIPDEYIYVKETSPYKLLDDLFNKKIYDEHLFEILFNNNCILIDPDTNIMYPSIYIDQPEEYEGYLNKEKPINNTINTKGESHFDIGGIGAYRIITIKIKHKLYNIKFLRDGLPVKILKNDNYEYWFLSDSCDYYNRCSDDIKDKFKNTEYVMDKYELYEKCGHPVEYEDFDYKQYNKHIESVIKNKLSGYTCLNNEDRIVF
mgnify:FL=1